MKAEVEIINQSICPCRYCIPPKRTINCHGSCKEYQEWSEAEKLKKHTRSEKERANSLIRRNIIKRAIKAKAKYKKMKGR